MNYQYLIAMLEDQICYHAREANRLEDWKEQLIKQAKLRQTWLEGEASPEEMPEEPE